MLGLLLSPAAAHREPLTSRCVLRWLVSIDSAQHSAQPGDTAVFPVSYGHYVKNLSPTEPLVFLELFKAPKFVDFSATQWLVYRTS